MPKAKLDAGLAFARRRCEDVVVLMLSAMFVVFCIQISCRYVFNFPIGWTHEVSVTLWIWLTLFGAAFVVRENEEMRFDLIYGAVNERIRRVMALITAAGLITTFTMSLPAVIDYVGFMRVEKTAYLKIRFDWLYAIYIVFALATIVRYLWLGWVAVFGRGPEAYDPTTVSSGV